MDEIVQIISNVGFPIAAFFLLYKQNTGMLEMVKDTLNKNTIVLGYISEKLDKLEQIIGKDEE